MHILRVYEIVNCTYLLGQCALRYAVKIIILQIRVLRTNVLVLRDAFSIGLWPLKVCGLCSIGVDGTWGKAVESESPSQAMALSSHQLSTLLVRWAQVGTSGQRQAPKFNNV